MQRAGQPSWQVAIDEPDDLHLVLFVRDACRLTVDDPGPLAPQVPDLSGLLDEDARARAGAAWPAWWDVALDAHRSHSRALPPGATIAMRHAQTRMAHAAMDGPQFASLALSPELQRAAGLAFNAFGQWWSPPWAPDRESWHKGRLGMPGVRGQLVDLHFGRSTVQQVVGRLERDLNRCVSPFDFAIDVVAVASPSVLIQEAHYAVIAGSLVGDETAFADWLRTALHPLA